MLLRCESLEPPMSQLGQSRRDCLRREFGPCPLRSESDRIADVAANCREVPRTDMATKEYHVRNPANVDTWAKSSHVSRECLTARLRVSLLTRSNCLSQTGAARCFAHNPETACALLRICFNPTRCRPVEQNEGEHISGL